MKLKGMRAVISGASQGLGLEIAKAFIKEGADILICARHAKTLSLAQEELTQLANNHSKILAQPTDIAKRQDVEELIATAILEFGKVDILVANAGIHGTKGAIDEVDWDEWSHAIDINLKGTVLQCKTILPYFKKQGSGKIIILSGGGATKPMPYLSAYAASKAAIVRFAETLAQEVQTFNIEVNAVAPGALNTRLLDEILTAGENKIGKEYYEHALQQQKNGGASLENAAALCTFLASKESNGITGKLISAVWDPWQDLPHYINELKQSDIYTLRRITPNDRNKNWDKSTHK